MLKNKKGIVFGIANNHSIAWGISRELAKNNAVENLENSEGWNLKSYIEIQEVDPEIVIP